MSSAEKKNTLTGLEIAVIGMAGRFPGANGINEFWDNLAGGVESITYLSDEQLEAEGIPRKVFQNPGYVKVRGGMLSDIDTFDAGFFDYLPEEAETMDPQLRIFHECTMEALHHAGYDPENYGGLIGLYAGATSNPFWLTGNLIRSRTASERMTSAYLNSNFFSTLISYKLNLKGPAVTLQTACSTSLVAIHQACRSLLTGECHMALAGGVTVVYPPRNGYMYEPGTIYSKDGHCRTFDVNSSGTVSGNGAAVVLLKRLDAAIGDCDEIHAIIKGSAINNDGKRKVGYTAPSVEAQAAVIRAAHQMAEIPAESITYIEAHGTATPLGDPVELEALKRAFDTKKQEFCAIGSVKSNVGHLDSAAGAAGFIKTVMALKNRQIPPSLHFKKPNPQLDINNSPFFVNTRLNGWETNGYPRRAGVSSFGIGGTNAHVILEEAPERPPSSEGRKQNLLLLSAKTAPALEQMTTDLAQYLENNPNINLSDAAYTLQVGRGAYKHRNMLVCSTANKAVEILAAGVSENLYTFNLKNENPPVIFMFTGQGAQYVNMGLDLYNSEPQFREEMDRCLQILEPLTSYNLRDILYPSAGDNSAYEASTSLLTRTEVTQPALFIFQYSLARIFMKWGLEPYAMTGHSIGEYTAACLSGVFSLENALKLVVQRGKLMQEMPGGAMLSVPLPGVEVKPFLVEPLALAAVNSSASCVVSGPYDSIDAFQAKMEAEGHKTRRLHTSHAFHSAMMDPIVETFKAAVEEIPLAEPAIPYISNVSGRWITKEQAVDPAYWAQHLRGTVLFSGALDTLLKEDSAIFIEVGPGKALSTFLRQHNAITPAHLAVNTVRHPKEQVDDTEFLLKGIGRLWLYGARINWRAFYPGQTRQRLTLPTYPFEKHRYRQKLDAMLNIFRELSGLGKGESDSAIRELLLEEETHSPTPKDIDDDSGQHTGHRMRPELATPFVPPGSEMEQKMADLWCAYFGLKEVGVYDDFFELGGDSLKATTLISRMHKAFNVNMPIQDFFLSPTISNTAKYVENAAKETYVPLIPLEEREYYPLSSPQNRLFIIQTANKNSTGYNLVQISVLEGDLDIQQLQDSFNQLIQRHESLRSSFPMVNFQPVQRVHRSVDFSIKLYRLETTDEPSEIEKQIELFIQPFDLEKPPLLRAKLVKISDFRYILMVDLHHIVSDGVSMELLKLEFAQFYNGEQLPKLKIQYRDYAVWQYHLSESETIKKQEKYWLDVFKGDIPNLKLPFDYPHLSGSASRDAAILPLVIDETLTGKINNRIIGTETTAFIYLLAVYNILLSYHCRQEDIVVVAPVSGRRHSDLQRIIGMFVNMLAYRNHASKDLTFSQFLAAVTHNALEAYANQDFQFEELIRRLRLQGSTDKNQLMNTVFTFQNILPEDPAVDDLKENFRLRVSPYKYKKKTAVFDLHLLGFETDGHFDMYFEYPRQLYKKSTIENMAGHMIEIIEQVVEEPEIKLKNITLTSRLVQMNPKIIDDDMDFGFEEI